MKSDIRLKVLAMAVVAGEVTSASAAVDSLQRVLASDPAGVGLGSLLPSFSYKPGATPEQDQIYVAGGGAGVALFRVDGVNRSSMAQALSPSKTLLVSTSQWTAWNQGLDGTNNPGAVTQGQPFAQGMLLNPVAINESTPAYSKAYIFDQGGAVRYNNVAQPTVAKRIYTWNLNGVNPPSDTYGAGQVLTSVLTQSQFATIANTAATGTPQANKQPVFSNNGKSAFFIDSSTGYGGLYQLNLETNAVTRLAVDTAGTRLAAEPGIAEMNGKDRIYINGSTTLGNVRGLSYVDYDRQAQTLSAAATVLSYSEIESFVGSSGGGVDINGIAVDGTNIYLDISGSSGVNRRSTLLRLDAQGRLSKVTTYNERKAFFGDVVTVTGKMQFRTTIDSNGQSVRQLLYGQSSTVTGYIGGVFLYEPGDFNRDGVVNSADAAALKQPGVLSLVGQSTTNSDLFKFDLNGDSISETTAVTAVVDYRDVKVFQKFFTFANGDADMNLSLDLSDLLTLQSNYLGDANKLWTTGDFSGDNLANRTDLDILASAWLSLGQAAPTWADVDANFTGQYRLDVLNAFAIPEPSAMGTLLPVAAFALRRRKR